MRLPCLSLLLAMTSACAAAQEHPKKPGVANAQLRIPIGQLQPDAVFAVPGAPDWLAVDEHVFVANGPKNSVARLDPKTNQVAATIDVGKGPDAGLAVGFGSVWAPCVGDSSLCRVDLATNKVVATIPIGIADAEGGLAVGADSVWMLTDKKGVLSRIDPASNKVVADIRVEPGCFCAAFGEGALWLTCTEKSLLLRVDPKKNLVVESIAVGKQPRFLAVGEGAVWTLDQGSGTVTRVDTKTNMVVATIEAGLPGGGGEIAVGEGSVWVTVFQYPLTRIDPHTNKVAQQFFGPGGDSVRVGHGSVWLCNLREGNVWRLDPKRIEATRRPE
jgi:YVTN family beta-propeller protein